MEERTVQDFVEDLISDGRTSVEILAIAKSTCWRTQIEEIEWIIREFPVSLRKRRHSFVKKSDNIVRRDKNKFEIGKEIVDERRLRWQRNKTG